MAAEAKFLAFDLGAESGRQQFADKQGALFRQAEDFRLGLLAALLVLVGTVGQAHAAGAAIDEIAPAPAAGLDGIERCHRGTQGDILAAGERL